MKYPDSLKLAWKKHSESKSDSAPRVLSLFAGCGGSSLGYSIAGFKEVAAVEFDKNACMTLRKNFQFDIFQEDINNFNAEKYNGAIDVLDGSPPCQGFSTIGKREFGDNRNSLFLQYVRILNETKPAAFVMENVPGMTLGAMKIIFSECYKALEMSGYKVAAKICNAADYGVPQSRKRLIFIGLKSGKTPTFPKKTALRPITAFEALEGVVNSKDELDMLLEAGKKYKAYSEWSLIKAGKTRTSTGSKTGFSARKFDPMRPAFTVCKNDGNISMHGSMHWAQQRRFTTAEYKRFASFPDEFIFDDEYKQNVYRIGNCVPPLFMAAIAKQIRELIEK